MRRDRYFRIQITRPGWFFIALCLGVGMAALNTGNNLLYLIFSMMLSFILLSGLLSNNTLQRVTLKPDFPERIFAGTPFPVRFTLRNRKRWFPSFSVSVCPERPEAARESHAYFLKVGAGRTERASDTASFARRGRHRLPPYRLETFYPFGLIRKYAVVDTEGEAVVFPRLLKIDSLLDAGHRVAGEFLAGRKGGFSNPYGIRPFALGDPARLIHWKSSARSGELKVKEFEKEKRFRIRIDLELFPSPDDTTLEKAVSAAASLVIHLAGRGYEIGLRINGESVEVRGRGYIDAYLTALALAREASAPSRPAPPSDDSASVVITNHSGPVNAGALLFLGPRELAGL